MPFPFFRQPDQMDCGPTCLRMVLAHYRRHISLQALRQRTGIGKQGVNLLGIGEAAEALGLRTEAVKTDIDTLQTRVPLPAILHWNQNHFVVLYRVRKGTVSIADPGRGLITCSIAELEEHWVSDRRDGRNQGVVLLLEPGETFQTNPHLQRKAGAGTLRMFLGYARPYRGLLWQLVIGLAAASMLQLFLPLITQSIVDRGIGQRDVGFVYLLLMAQAALLAGRMTIEFVRGWILLHVSSRINLSIVTSFLVKLMRLPIAFFDSKQAGDILQRMNDRNRIESFLTGTSLTTIFSLLNLVVYSVVLALFNGLLFAVFAICSVAYAVWVLLFLRKRRSLDYRRFEVAVREQSATIQLVQGMQEIKLHGMERRMRWGWERLQAKLFALSQRALALNQQQQAGAFLLNEGKNLLVTFLAARAVIEGDLTLGGLLAVQFIVGQLNSPVEQILGFVQAWQSARISMERLNEIHSLDEEESAEQKFEPLPPEWTARLAGGQSVLPQAMVLPMPALATESVPASIRFRNVSFAYPGAGQEAVLQELSFEIPRGKTTAIVGGSGSGKTTLLKLLLQFYEPQRGALLYGRRPLRRISPREWRSHCGVVMQDSYLFSDTIAANVAVGEDEPDEERLTLALRAAVLDEFVESLPLGHQTRVGAEGIGISTGQKQRLLIARAVYRDPSFIFLDEATNSLDASNEQRIVENLRRFFVGRTVVVVAHRLSTVRKADQIVVLNGGRITEIGTHDELVLRGGDYYTLVSNQLELAK